MNNNIKLGLAVGLCAAAFFGDNILNTIKNLPHNVPTPAPVVNVDVVEPSIEYKGAVKDIVATDIDPKDASMISCFFLEVADVVKNDVAFIKTTGQFREFNSVAGGLNFNTALKNKYENLGEAIDAVIVSSIGKEDVALDNTKRNNLVKSLQAIAWGVTQ